MTVMNMVSPLASVVRPMIGLGLAATALMVFKPLLSGVLRAALLVLKPRESAAQVSEKSRVRGILQLTRMARDLDATQPSLAAEMRNLASRG